MGLEFKELTVPKSTSTEVMGIDLGTTNSAVAVYSNGTVPKLLPIGADMAYTVPSCVRWNTDGTFTVGAEAYKERYKENVVYSVKRMMGSGETVKLHNENGTMEMTPADVSAEILRHIKNRVAELYKPITKCVITVPAYFDQRQMGDTLEAAKLAGLECLQILKEPTSASYIYSKLGYAQTGSVLIYDLGGGTFDVTHMTFLRKDAIPKKLLTSLKNQYGIELDKGGADNTSQYFCRVLGTYGDMHLGGDDIDKLMGDRILEKTGIQLSDQGRERLYLYCEDFKKANFTGSEYTIEGNKIQLAGDDLDWAVDKVFDRTLALMDDIDMSDVSTIVLVGGSTKSQRIRDNLSKAFPKVEISAVLDPDATVALGAGSVAEALSSNKGLMYADVLPLPIGILVDGKKVEVCIKRNTSMPYVMTRTFYTMVDNQEQVTLHVYQGVSTAPEECTYLGRLTLEGIPQAPAGEVSVGVNFILTGQGQLKVTSNINGETRDETLVIDNIFSAGKDEEPSVELDDFEQTFLESARASQAWEELEGLFQKRKTFPEGSKEREEVEDQIVMLI